MLTHSEAKEFLALVERSSFSAIERLLRDGFAREPIEVTDATLSLTIKDHGGRLIRSHRAAGITYTLPAAVGSGARFPMFTKTTITSNNLIVQVANATDVMSGLAQLAQDAADTLVAFETAADSDTVTMNGSTKGGIKGDWLEFVDVDSGLWHVKVIGSATGIEVTPFSAAVS